MFPLQTRFFIIFSGRACLFATRALLCPSGNMISYNVINYNNDKIIYKVPFEDEIEINRISGNIYLVHCMYYLVHAILFSSFFGELIMHLYHLAGPPRIVSKSPVNITQEVETNVTLVCTIIADPDPVITWKRADADGNFVEISVTSGIYDGNYTIFNARIEDSGIYLCNASNKLGYDSYRTEVVIKPGKIYEYSCEFHASMFRFMNLLVSV